MSKKALIIIAVVVAVSGLGVYLKEKDKTAKQTSYEPNSQIKKPLIGRLPTDLPKPLARMENERVVVNLETREVVGELAPEVSYEFWTYNATVPGPFIRVKEGDVVEVHLKHEHSHMSEADIVHGFAVNGLVPIARADEGDTHTAESGESHGTHSIDLHAVEGPGGGATLSQTKPQEETVFEFKATRAGLYVYHCASPYIPTHIANGMYGLILVEPRGGLPKVDREFYVMQGEFYTKGISGEKGLQEFSKEKLLAETPEYFVFNGGAGALSGSRALKASVGETVRIFFGVGSFVPSNFHVIGAIFDKLYREGDIVSPPARNVQTTTVPAGGAIMTDFKVEAPGKYLLVDHALPRSIDRGALGELIISGEDQGGIIKKLK